MSMTLFQFESLAALLFMDGHGPYVWSAYGISAVILLYLVIAPVRRQRKLIAEQKNRAANES